MPKKPDNLQGQTFGRLYVVERVAFPLGETAWLCQCDCGNITHEQSYNLKAGRTVSCGCAKKEHMAQLGRNRRKTA